MSIGTGACWILLVDPVDGFAAVSLVQTEDSHRSLAWLWQTVAVAWLLLEENTYRHIDLIGPALQNFIGSN